MIEPKLRFQTQPYHANHVGNLLLQFQEQGYCVLTDVFEPDSVDEYLAQVQAELVPGQHGRLQLPPSPLRIAPTRSPHIREMVKTAISPALMRPNISIFEVAWLIAPAEKPGAIVNAWHKDRDHQNLACKDAYSYPMDIHVGMYFGDMTAEHGPTEVIPRSHRDPQQSPYNPASKPQLFLCRKQDVVMWDQRLWHRATPRTAPGHRIFALFGFYPIPSYDAHPRAMDTAQRHAWQEAKDPVEAMLYGGLYAERDK